MGDEIFGHFRPYREILVIFTTETGRILPRPFGMSTYIGMVLFLGNHPQSWRGKPKNAAVKMEANLPFEGTPLFSELARPKFWIFGPLFWGQNGHFCPKIEQIKPIFAQKG